ncbi:MAG: DUF7512 family protein [Halodesulfurarchaeum sp.]
MIGLFPASRRVQAPLLLVVTFIEAVVVSFGYGYVERFLAPFVVKATRNG